MKKQLLTAALAVSAFATAQAQTPSFTNNGFETWEEYSPEGAPMVSLDRPTGWYGSDEITGQYSTLLLLMFGITAEAQLFESADAHEGTKAARIVSVELNDSLGNIPGVLTNAKISLDFADLEGELDGESLLSALKYSGGTPMYGKKVDTVSAWIKTPASNMDASTIIITAMKKSTTAGGADTFISIGSGAAVLAPDGGTGYRKVAVEMTYGTATVATDTLVVAFLSSAFTSEMPVTPGNTLMVDDVMVQYSDGVTSITQPLMSENSVAVYPNPANTNIWFNLDAKAKAANYTLSIFDAAGRNVYQKQLTEQVNNIDIAAWATGTYFYQLTNKNTAATSTGTFVK